MDKNYYLIYDSSCTDEEMLGFIHIEHPVEYSTLCGIALLHIDHDETIDNVVTCKDCIKIIKHCKNVKITQSKK